MKKGKRNITLEARTESLPGRNVYLIFKFINHEDLDFYYRADKFPYKEGFSVNNTYATKKHNRPWQSCGPYMSDPHRYFDKNAIRYSHIPANGVYELKIDIVAECSFLEHEPPTKDLFVKYSVWPNDIANEEGGVSLYLTPDYNDPSVGHVHIPVVIKSFDLIAEIKNEDEFL